MPRVVVKLSTVRAHRRAAATVRRALGGRGKVRLYVAFDDPSSAVALLGLSERLRGRRIDLIVEPVVARGIPDDPAAGAKRRYAVVDARRLARRDGRELSRTEPVPQDATAHLAHQAAALPATERTAFCVAAMRRLWFESDGPLDPVDAGDGALPGERGMRLRRLYDTPVAVVGGQWFFAHERLAQIESALDDLGWTA
jgi:2-hydroxychromene-2-carboxylate isomerase